MAKSTISIAVYKYTKDEPLKVFKKEVDIHGWVIDGDNMYYSIMIEEDGVKFMAERYMLMYDLFGTDNALSINVSVGRDARNNLVLFFRNKKINVELDKANQDRSEHDLEQSKNAIQKAFKSCLDDSTLWIEKQI